jgi:hypothetical protein
MTKLGKCHVEHRCFWSPGRHSQYSVYGSIYSRSWYFSLCHGVQTGSGAHPASCSIGTCGSFPGVKWQGRETDHSLPSSAEVKNAWSYTSTPPICLHGVELSKAQGQLYFSVFRCFWVRWQSPACGGCYQASPMSATRWAS